MAITFIGTETQQKALTMEDLLRAKSLIGSALPAEVYPTPFKVVTSSLLYDVVPKQIKYPRCHKKRIQKKFKKLWTRLHSEPWQDCFLLKEQGLIVCHPSIANQIQKALDKIMVDNEQRILGIWRPDWTCKITDRS